MIKLMEIYFNSTEKNRLFKSMAFTFILGLAAHAYAYFNCLMSHDSLTAIYAGRTEEMCKLSLGRFIVPIYRFFRGSTCLPWIIGILSLFWIGLSVYAISRMFRINDKWAIILIAGVMAINPTVTAMTATYIFELDFDMLALFLAVVSVLIWKERPNILGLIIGGTSLAVSIGIYQSYISVTISLIIIASIYFLINGEKCKDVIIKGLKGVAMIAIAGAMYYIAYYLIVCPLFNVVPEERTDLFALLGGDYVELLKDAYTYVAARMHKIYPNWLLAIHIPFLAALVINIFYRFIQCGGKISKGEKFGKLAFVIALLAVLPFGINITYLISAGFVHDLMIYSFWLIYIMSVVFIARLDKSGGSSKIVVTSIKTVIYVVIGIVIWNNIIWSNTAYLKKDLEQKSTLSLMTRVETRMEEYPGYIPGETPVVFIGSSDMPNTNEGFIEISELTGLHANSVITYYSVYENYFKYILNCPIKLCGEERAKSLSPSPEVMEMNVFPKENCIKFVDDILVVKMGE